MSRIKYSFDVTVTLDMEDYRVPTDGRLSTSLKDELVEAIEVGTSMEVQSVHITSIKKLKS